MIYSIQRSCRGSANILQVTCEMTGAVKGLFFPDVQMCMERHDMVKTPKIHNLLVHDSVAVATRVTLLCSISHSSAKIFFGENLSSDTTTLKCCFANLWTFFL